MKNFERFIVYPLILVQIIALVGMFIYLRDDIQIVDGDIKSITTDEVVIRNSDNEIVAMIGNVDDNGQISVRDRYGRVITLIGVDEVDNEFKARIVVGDHYENYSIGEYYGVGGVKKEERYDN